MSSDKPLAGRIALVTGASKGIGAATAQACLRAGLLDEMELQVIPVLLGQGRRLFENMPPDHVELQLVRVLDGPDVQHLRYRVRTEG